MTINVMANSSTATIPVTLTIGPKRKLRHVKREATLREVKGMLKDLVGNKPESWHLSLNKKPLDKWSDAINFFDKQNCKQLELEVKSGLLPEKCGNGIKSSKNSVMTRISYGQRTKARRLPKSISKSELHSVVRGIFPTVNEQKYHLEDLDGVWLEDGDDWKSMQENLKSVKGTNGRIDLKLVIDQPTPSFDEVEMPRKETAGEVKENQSATKSQVSVIKHHAEKGKASNYMPNLMLKLIPEAIHSGNYRGGLQECLMQHPQTRGYRLNFETKQDNPKSVRFQTRGTLEVEQLFSVVACGTGPSKRASIQNCAKQFLEKLKIIPASEKDSLQRPAEKASGRMSRQSRRPHWEDGNNQLQTFHYNRDVQTPPKYNGERVRREAIWTQINRILTHTKGTVEAVDILHRFPGRRDNVPSISELNSVLFEKVREGLLQMKYNHWGRPGWSKPFDRRAYQRRGRPKWIKPFPHHGYRE